MIIADQTSHSYRTAKKLHTSPSYNPDEKGKAKARKMINKRDKKRANAKKRAEARRKKIEQAVKTLPQKPVITGIDEAREMGELNNV